MSISDNISVQKIAKKDATKLIDIMVEGPCPKSLFLINSLNRVWRRPCGSTPCGVLPFSPLFFIGNLKVTVRRSGNDPAIAVEF